MALEQRVGLQLVLGGAGDAGRGDEGGQLAALAGRGEEGDVEVGEREDDVDGVLGAQRAERREVGGVGERWRGGVDVGRVARGGERVGVDGDDAGVLGEGRDDVVAPADAREQDRRQRPQPPVAPL